MIYSLFLVVATAGIFSIVSIPSHTKVYNLFLHYTLKTIFCRHHAHQSNNLNRIDVG